MKPAFALILKTNLIAAGATIGIRSFAFDFGLAPDHVQSIGGSMTLLMLFFGIATYLQARQGLLARGFIIGIAVPGPIYALLPGPYAQVVSYHIVSLGIHTFILLKLRRQEKEKGETQNP